jgi:hypothetical protein
MLVNLSGSHLLGPCIIPCGDANNNGVSDNSCMYFNCELDSCIATPRHYADMGGFNGACPPDGACDGNDRFHALNCFSNLDTGGPGTSYPCESSPPQALNVDAAKLGAPCLPDGVCDGNDAFAALNCFSQATTCHCNGPAPDMPGKPERPLGSTGLSARASAAQVAPGETVLVDVHLDGAVKDLRGYQLHVLASGGEAGRLELIDISVRAADDRAFAGLPAWEAFNVGRGQMVAGLDSAGIAVPAGAYLATFTYRASEDAAGEFSIDVLADDSDETQRTWLFPTPEQGWIEVPSTSPAVVEVVPSASRPRAGRLKAHQRQ